MILAIIGSRTVSPTVDEITAALCDKYGVGPDAVTAVVSGRARGGDIAGEAWAKWYSIPLDLVPITTEDMEKWGKYLAPKARNGRIADRASHCLAFWDRMSSGTADCIARFRMRGKPVEVVPAERVKRAKKA